MARTVRPSRPKLQSPTKRTRQPVISKVARKKSLSIKTPTVKQLPIKKPTKLRYHVEKEIKYYRQSITHLVPKACFIRMLKGMVLKMDTPMRFTKDALDMLQDAYESYIVANMETSYLATVHAKRVTLKPIDINLIRKIKDRQLF
ncbi:Histones H3 and H4 [Trachipleistophora hominis]|uniref:Histones H3 and H4 n=1 Tax=Trachipleistophora hominis TaxID=72359 RepID=L7JSA9_TRAHO|nr:Histones H3 and H4 [Trachipleistophora hominis]